MCICLIAKRVEKTHDEKSSDKHRPKRVSSPFWFQRFYIRHEHFLHNSELCFSQISQVHQPHRYIKYSDWKNYKHCVCVRHYRIWIWKVFFFKFQKRRDQQRLHEDYHDHIRSAVKEFGRPVEQSCTLYTPQNKSESDEYTQNEGNGHQEQEVNCQNLDLALSVDCSRVMVHACPFESKRINVVLVLVCVEDLFT